MTPLYFLFSDSNKNNIYIKRDDLIPISFGGNKARKAIMKIIGFIAFITSLNEILDKRRHKMT